MIPEFPNFKKLELSDKEEIEKFASEFPPYSTFNFTNLWAWDIRSDRKLSKLNGNLVIFFTDYTTEEPFLSFLGIDECEDTVLQLLHFAQESKIFPKLRFITEESVQQLHSINFNIEEDRGSFDYLFSSSELAKLSGNKFKEERHLAEKFSKKYPDAIFHTQDLSDASVQDKLLLVLREWEDRKKIQNKTYDLIFEEKAFRRLLETADSHTLILSCISLHDTVLAFSIDEILPDQNTMAHFIKADNSYSGIYEFLNKELAQYLTTQNSMMWNWQQDLNLENLRKTKMGYRPVAFLKKYTVSLSSQQIG